MEYPRFEQLIEILKSRGIQFGSGLTDQEINNIQGSFKIIFPPHLKLFLQLGLPISDGFVNWRYCLESGDYKQKITSVIEWPLDGILFDVKNNEFWLERWGDKPESEAEKQETVKKNYVKYPRLYLFIRIDIFQVTR